MKAKAIAFAACCLMLIGLSAKPADATTVTFDWSLAGPAASLGGVPLSGSGTITATVGANGDSVTAITGSLGGIAINGPTSFFGSDNLLFPTGTTPVDTSGIALALADGESVNIFSFFAEGSTPSGNAFGEYTSGSGFGVGTFALSPVGATPLPPTWTMMLVGLAGVGFFVYRRQQRGSVALSPA
jgi:hypothetical protein